MWAQLCEPTPQHVRNIDPRPDSMWTVVTLDQQRVQISHPRPWHVQNSDP